MARELEAGGFAHNQVRVLREPLGMQLADASSTPHADFKVALGRDLVAMGATIAEANAYASGIGSGGVLVFATGTDEQADQALATMNRHGAAQVEELAGTEPAEIGMTAGAFAPAPDNSSQTGRIRQPGGGGARVFVW
jgi:hypothetical protein